MFISVCKSCKAEPPATQIEVCHDCAEGIEQQRPIVTDPEQAALIIESVRLYLSTLEDENFKNEQIKLAQSFFKRYFNFKLSDDGITVEPCY